MAQELLISAVAIHVVDPVTSATSLGQYAWIEQVGQLGAAILRSGGGARRQFSGPAFELLTFDDAAKATSFARTVVRESLELKIEVGVAVHAGEATDGGNEESSLPGLVAAELARCANETVVLVTDQAAVMAQIDAADLYSVAGITIEGWPGQPAVFSLDWPVALISSRNSEQGRLLQHEIANRLTLREREVVSLLAEGRSNRAIAAAMSIALGTVERHVSNILRKLRFGSRSKIARWAIENQIGAIDLQSKKASGQPE
jgi:DNA-binding CsgD family transcriptional regulator